MSRQASADLLETIVAATRQGVGTREVQEPRSALERRALSTPSPAGRFRAALERQGGFNVIAECKRRSPSKGVLRADYDAAWIARAYERAGAAAISVLTEPTFFDGSMADLAAVRAAVSVPILRKDFMVSEYQLFEARAAGADAVLLIVAALSRDALVTLARRATDLGLDALVEVHDATELARAGDAVDTRTVIIGVNNRNLRTLEVNVRASEEVIARMPAGALAVSESGLRSHEDLVRLSALGYRGFLVGERLVTQEDPGRALETLLRG
jgi:indole-3-glycerol phosphate synthase